MKKSLFLGINLDEILPIHQLKFITGGFASCVAACGSGSVLCQGSNCSATDDVGCSSDQEAHSCRSSGKPAYK